MYISIYKKRVCAPRLFQQLVGLVDYVGWLVGCLVGGWLIGWFGGCFGRLGSKIGW